jgi:hypothetical protein
METFEEFVTETKIISYLCRMRAKLAKQRNKKHLIHLLSSNPRYNYHRATASDSERQLQEILPPRKRWIKLGEKSRNKNGQVLNSIDKNIKSLTITIESFKKNNPNEPFLLNLNNFVASIKKAISDPYYAVDRPSTYPKQKDEKTESRKICRPISIFNLKDRIIIGLANKYLTEVLDRYFYAGSLAFRSKRQIGDINQSPSHHDAIREIRAYLDRQNGKQLWVAEADMMKFYDTVNHAVIKYEFRKLLKRVKRVCPTLPTESIQRLFYNYLGCYAFNKDVYPLNKKPDYFKKAKIVDGRFGWVEKEFLQLGHYKSINNARIGVPQGGALSGLISNIVLNYADRQVQKVADKDLLYLRYCDDMIIMHPDQRKCEEAFTAYSGALQKLKLIPHGCAEAPKSSLDFWKAKSKLPYKWGNKNADSFPWVGFVGYEIRYDGSVRARKSSLKKEMKKQYELVNEIRLAAKEGEKRATNKTIEESVINRLVGMSVGRVKLWNAKSIKNEMCWANGFAELTDNKHTRIQLKRLDACRNKLFRKLKKALKETGNVQAKDRNKRRQLVYYGKPFSYYYHVIERKKE